MVWVPEFIQESGVAMFYNHFFKLMQGQSQWSSREMWASDLLQSWRRALWARCSFAMHPLGHALDFRVEPALSALGNAPSWLRTFNCSSQKCTK